MAKIKRSLAAAVFAISTAQIFHEMVPLIDRAVTLAPAEQDLRNAGGTSAMQTSREW
jgi:hypothetical protein